MARPPYPFMGCDVAVQTREECFVEVGADVRAPMAEPLVIQPIVTEPHEELSTLKVKFENGEFEVKVGKMGKKFHIFQWF